MSDLALLLVDDVEENLLALEAALGPLGHRTVRARSGEEALRHLLKEDDFAAVILDVQMPGLDGFATAEAIRERERTKDLPILFLTAMSRDDEHRLRGFAAGGMDYIFKPVDPGVLRAKVSVFVRLYTADRTLRAQQEELRRQAAELTRSNADLDQFASVVSHDLVDPLNVITGYLELLSDRLEPSADGETREWIGRMDSCARRIHALVDELLDYSRALTDRAGPNPDATTDLADATADALDNLGSLLATSGSTVEILGQLAPVAAGRREMAQIVQNLVANSVVHSGGRPVHVTVEAEQHPAGVRLKVSDDGPGLPASQMRRVFGMFERYSDGPAPTTGLGLAICRRIVTRLDGRIWMEANQPCGVSVLVDLPAGAAG